MEQQDTEQKTNQYCCDQMETIKQIIFGLNKENISQCVDSINNKIDKTYPISFNLIISQMIYIIFRIKMNDINVYLDFINEIYKFETKNNYKSKIIDVFTHYLLDKDSQESNYILNNMYENDLLEQEITRTQNSAHSARCINDCELHKQLLKEGHNPNELATTIRNDEIEKLQEISSQSNFNFNQTIEPSLYEICSFINQSNISLIDYAAFFSAVKCFKFLLMNEAKVTNTGKYAIAGGNEEIIHLCEQNHSSFEDAYETAIEFHRNDIFHYLYDNKIKENDNLKALGKKCILYHNYEILSFLEKEGMTIDDDIILEASKNGNLFLIIHFLKGSQPSKSLLFNSINTGNSELIQFILDKGIDVNSLDSHGNTALILASEIGQLEIVKLLLEKKGIDINAKNEFEKTALMLASKNGKTKVVKILLEQKGINIYAKERWGETALMFASLNGHIEIVKLLLEQKGIDINEKDNTGETVLMKASLNGHTEIVKLLLEQEGIDINEKDNYGLTALMKASYYDYAEIVKLLLEQKGIEVNNKYKEFGKTELMIALQKGYTKIVKLLLEHEGIDVNAQDNDGQTALMLATSNACIESFELLLEHKEIDINAKDKLKKTALMLASSKGNIEAVKLLLKQEGIDINAKDKFNNTALIEATQKGHTEIVKLLIEHKGIDINAKNWYGKSALTIATKSGYTEIIKLITEHK